MLFVVVVVLNLIDCLPLTKKKWDLGLGTGDWDLGVRREVGGKKTLDFIFFFSEGALEVVERRHFVVLSVCSELHKVDLIAEQCADATEATAEL